MRAAPLHPLVDIGSRCMYSVHDLVRSMTMQLSIAAPACFVPVVCAGAVGVICMRGDGQSARI